MRTVRKPSSFPRRPWLAGPAPEGLAACPGMEGRDALGNGPLSKELFQ